MSTRRPSGVDMRVFHPCTLIRLFSLALGKWFLMFVRTGIRLQQVEVSIGMALAVTRDVLQSTFVDF